MDAMNGTFIALSEITPMAHGPREAPMSPPAARNANSQVPASGKRSADKTRVPGQSRLTAMPQTAQAINERASKGDRATVI